MNRFQKRSSAVVLALTLPLVLTTPAHAASADAGYDWTVTWDDQPTLYNPASGCGLFGVQVNVGQSSNANTALAKVDVGRRNGYDETPLLWLGDEEDLNATFKRCADEVPTTIKASVSYYAPTNEGFGYYFQQEYIKFEETYPFEPNLVRVPLPQVVVQAEYPDTIYLPYSCELIYRKKERSLTCFEDNYPDPPLLINKAKPRKIVPTSYDDSRETALTEESEYWMKLDKGNLRPGTYYVIRSDQEEFSRWKCSVYFKEVCYWYEGQPASVGGLSFQWNGTKVSRVKNLSGKKARNLLRGLEDY